jgi:hypothetical protein
MKTRHPPMGIQIPPNFKAYLDELSEIVKKMRAEENSKQTISEKIQHATRSSQ